MVKLEQQHVGPVFVFGLLKFDSGHVIPVALPLNEYAELETQMGASLPTDPTATSSPEGDGGHSVEALRGSGPSTPSPLMIEGCTCPWNNGYVVPAVVRHHIDCPTLKNRHHAYDQCAPGGHRDDTVRNVIDEEGVWVVVLQFGGCELWLARPLTSDAKRSTLRGWETKPYV